MTFYTLKPRFQDLLCQAWIMRRRVQAEMDQLVEAAGFRKVEQRIDEWGIFTVSIAERVAS